MGRRNRPKRDGRFIIIDLDMSVPGYPTDEEHLAHLTDRQRFQVAMAEEEFEHVGDKGSPCARCGTTGRNAVIWIPSPALSKHLGARDGVIRTYIYALCDACVRLGLEAVKDEVEDEILT